jgi:hypothetical protein
MELFDYLDALTDKKIPFDSTDDDFVKSYDPYIINRFISMNESFVMLVNEINKYPNISKEAHYNYFLSFLPKRKLYFKYIKKQKDLTEKEVNYVASYFSVTTREAKEYIKILDSETVKLIIDKYKYGEGQSSSL